MSNDGVKSLSNFIDIITHLRESWGISEHSELWFRGEDRQDTTPLRPRLYRPRKGQPSKPIPKLLKIENILYEDFQWCAVQLCNEKTPADDWDWDAYFLMQHHGSPTRLLDWSDGALMALHFAVRDKPRCDAQDALVYVLDPDRLQEQIEALSAIKIVKNKWKTYVKKNPSSELKEDEWEYSYLPTDEKNRRNLMPKVPLLLDFPHITRRVAAQRSRFVVFGTDPAWLDQKTRQTSFFSPSSNYY